MFVFSGERTEACEKRLLLGEKNNIFSLSGEIVPLGSHNAWVNARQHHYDPSLDDIVIGVVKSKSPEYYKIDIGAPAPAVIGCFDFPNATKRNRVNLEPGEAVLGQVVDDKKYSDVRVSCRTEAVSEMGVLAPGGVIIKASPSQCRLLLLRGIKPGDVPGVSKIYLGMNGYIYACPGTTQAAASVWKLLEG